MIEQIDHSSNTQPVTTRGLSESLPALRIRRNATIARNTGSTTLITPNVPAASVCRKRPKAPLTRNHSEAQNSTERITITKHRPSRRYIGSYSPTPVSALTAAPKPRGMASSSFFHSGSSPTRRSSSDNTRVRAVSSVPVRFDDPLDLRRVDVLCSCEEDEDVVRAIATLILASGGHIVETGQLRPLTPGCHRDGAGRIRRHARQSRHTPPRPRDR